MLIDFHTHIFPDGLAEKVIPMLAEKGNVTPYGAATVADTLAAMDAEGVDRSVMLSIATNAKQMRSVNDFAAGVNARFAGRITAFGSVFPDADGSLDELDRIKELGLPGVKLHPEYQQFHVEKEKYFKLYEKCEKLGLILVFHAGKDVGYPDTLMAPPKALSIVTDSFPKAKMIFAHMGGFQLFADVLRYLAGSAAYFDTAVVDRILDRGVARAIIEKHSPERILFGTDRPWGTAPDTVRYIESLGLTDAAKQKIYHENAEGLLGLSCDTAPSR